jgi:hypothetical protein
VRISKLSPLRSADLNLRTARSVFVVEGRVVTGDGAAYAAILKCPLTYWINPRNVPSCAPMVYWSASAAFL